MFRIYMNGTPAQWTLPTAKACREWIKRNKKMDLDLQKRYGSKPVVHTFKEEP